MSSVVISTMILTILSIVSAVNIILMWQVFKVMMHCSNIIEQLNQVLPATIETINEAQELINEKKQRIGFDG